MVARFDAVRLFIFVLLQYLNTTTAFYFATECSDVTVFEGVYMPQHFRTLPSLDQGWTQCPALDVVLYQVLRVSEQQC